MEGILVSQGPLISLRLLGAVLSVVIWDTLWETALGPDIVAYIRVLRLRLPGLHNFQIGVVHRMVEVVLLLIEVVVVEVHNVMEVVLIVMIFRVGQRLRLQMLLSQVLFRFVIDHLMYYFI